MFGTAARYFEPVHKFELPTVIADSVSHERLAYFHWPQWVTWLVTWWVTWSRWPETGRHIGKFSLWTTLLRFSRSAQISLFSNFTKLGQLFFDNIFFGLTSQGFCADQNYPWKKCIKSKQSKRDREKLQPLFNIPLLNTPWQSSGLCALDTLEYSLIQSIKKVWEILFSRGEKPLNPAQFATCPPSVFRHSRQANSALSGPKFRAGGPKFCTGPIICTGSKFCLVLDLVNGEKTRQWTSCGTWLWALSDGQNNTGWWLKCPCIISI